MTSEKLFNIALKLSKQASDCVDKEHPEFDSHALDAWQNHYRNKFAELIIQECIKLCDDSNEEYAKSCDWAAEQIKNHFGVE